MSTKAKLLNELELLLSESESQATSRSQQAFNDLTGLKKDLILFGAGNLGRKIAQKLSSHPEINILGFSDNNPQTWNTEIHGYKVYSPMAAASLFGKSAAFIVTIWTAGSSHRFKNTHAQLSDLGCESVVSFVYLFWKYAEIFLPYYAVDVPQKVLPHKNEILVLAEQWQDMASLETYVEMIRWRLDGDFAKVSEPDSAQQYFVEEIYEVTSQDKFYDIGAFDGDTLGYMLNTYQEQIPEITCFEPDTVNYQKLLTKRETSTLAQQARIHCWNMAITDHQGFLTFNSDGTAASAPVSHGKESIPCNSLDNFAKNAPPTFVKMDIEGAEIDALNGCQDIIHEHQPFLAISAYHLQEHLWEIPILIKKLNPQYELFLRSHNGECFDTICYAR